MGSEFREWSLVDMHCCAKDGSWRCRIRKCLQFLANRPETVIAVVGHGMLFQAMQGKGSHHFDNVEVRKCQLDVASLTLSAGEEVYKPKVPATWLAWYEDDTRS